MEKLLAVIAGLTTPSRMYWRFFRDWQWRVRAWWDGPDEWGKWVRL